MHTCNKCKGQGKLTIGVTSYVPDFPGPSTSSVTMPCIYCNGTGSITQERKDQLAREDAMWCKCETPSEYTDFYDDGQHPEIHKHHYRCKNCGKITQIG